MDAYQVRRRLPVACSFVFWADEIEQKRSLGLRPTQCRPKLQRKGETRHQARSRDTWGPPRPFERWEADSKVPRKRPNKKMQKLNRAQATAFG